MTINITPVFKPKINQKLNMSKSSVNEWDASDASDDDDGLKTPKTPGSAVSSPEAQTPKYSNVSPSYNPT